MRVRVKICGVTTPEGVAAAAGAGADAIGFVLAESSRRVGIDRAADLARDVPPFVARVAVFRHPALDEVEAVLDAFAPDWIQSEPVPGLADRVAGRAHLLTVLHDAPDLADRIERDGTDALDPARADSSSRAVANHPVPPFLSPNRGFGDVSRTPRLGTPNSVRELFVRPPVLLEGPGRGGRGERPDWDRAARIARCTTLVLAGGLTADNVGDAIRRVRPYAVDVSSGVESAPGVKSVLEIERFIAAVRAAERAGADA
jgi:phosphoribosylanthranilate isomerase